MFDYDAAFSRNLGWVTEAEQQQLRSKCIAIAGLGGVGGSHLLTLARLGIGAFKLADFDTFDVPNFNRQAGAMVSTLGQPKVDVLQRMALDINPELKIATYPTGVDESNLDNFLQGVDLYVDSLDFFAFDARKKMFAACAAKGIPAITAAPLGMGAAMLIFMPGQMTFEEYFRLEGHDEFEQGIRFLLGLAPARLHNTYLVDPSRIDLENRKGPSTGMACQLCAGVAATNALKILLKRGDIIAAPKGLHFDAYSNKLTQTKLHNGNQGLLQQLKIRVAKTMLSRQQQSKPAANSVSASATPIEKVLDLARWAPSGDNTQVWRFELIDTTSAWIHGHDTRDQVVYDFEGRPSQIALGALLATLRIAASALKFNVEIVQELPTPDTINSSLSRFRITLTQDEPVIANELASYITSRSVQRRPLATTPLMESEKRALESAAGPNHQIVWQEGAQLRQRIAGLLFRSAQIRLTMPEAFQVHRSIIQWNSRFSPDKVPDQAIGMDPVGLKMMRWALQSWQRVQFLNRYLAGTWLPRIQLDLLPALKCAAHFALVAKKPATTLSDFVDAGAALQRVWLTATKLGLQMQPEMTPLIFSWYASAGVPLSQLTPINTKAATIQQQFSSLLGDDIARKTVFFSRIGHGPQALARSTRQDLARLMTK